LTPARVAGAGLGAGFTNLVLGIGFAHTVGIERFQAILREHGLRAIGEPADAIPHTIVRLLMGVVTTLLFVCVTSRFGAGPRAALVAGGVAWALSYAYTAWQHAHLGLYPPSWALRIGGWGLLEMTITALVGGWLATGRAFWSRRDAPARS
jgi:hypothetical protein